MLLLNYTKRKVNKLYKNQFIWGFISIEYNVVCYLLKCISWKINTKRLLKLVLPVQSVILINMTKYICVFNVSL